MRRGPSGPRSAPTHKWRIQITVDISARSLVLSLRPGSGLGNRVRALLSAAAVAEAEQRRFYYHWPITGSFGARVDELWSAVPGTALNSPGPEPLILDEQIDGQWRPASIERHRNDEVISVSTAYVLHGWGGERKWTDLFRDLPVSQEVESLISRDFRDASQRSGSVIGVQVRSHPTLTHPRTLENSPVEWFTRRMLELHARDDSVSFFLSCDTREAEIEISSAVPNVRFVKKTGRYNSREGLIESVADLKLLSKTDYILAPYWSSFADLAWQMSGRAMPIETSQGVKNAE